MVSNLLVIQFWITECQKETQNADAEGFRTKLRRVQQKTPVDNSYHSPPEKALRCTTESNAGSFPTVTSVLSGHLRLWMCDFGRKWAISPAITPAKHVNKLNQRSRSGTAKRSRRRPLANSAIRSAIYN